MRTLPKFSYKGLTIVLSNPSRMDTKELLSGYAGVYLNECLQPEMNRFQCDIRTADETMPLLDGTKAILLLGQNAMHRWAINTHDYTLNQKRGTPLDNQWNLPCYASFFPQDCMDVIDYESKHNPQDIIEDEKEDKEEYEGKRKGATARSNYRFWLAADCKKLIKKICMPGSGLVTAEQRPDSKMGGILQSRWNNSLCSSPTYNIYPSSQEIIHVLSTTKNESAYLDIETDTSLNFTCVGVGINTTIYVIPILRYNYTAAYRDIAQIMRAFGRLLLSNEIVTHNSQFDLFVNAYKYNLLPGPNHYDTMLAHHRCYPEAEMSLGHCMSLWTDEPYHKDEGIFMPNNVEQERKLWEYNGKDVWGTMLVRRAIDSYAKTVPGLTESIAQSNACIRPYLINTLTGIRYSQEALAAKMKYNDRLMMQYLRWIKTLVGKDTYERIQGKKTGNIASSSSQAAEYFHDFLNYPIISRSKKTGKASLDADAMYKLKLKQLDNPVIDIVLAFRERAKESGSLKFTPYRVDNQRITDSKPDSNGILQEGDSIYA